MIGKFPYDMFQSLLYWNDLMRLGRARQAAWAMLINVSILVVLE